MFQLCFEVVPCCRVHQCEIKFLVMVLNLFVLVQYLQWDIKRERERERTKIKGSKDVNRWLALFAAQFDATGKSILGQVLAHK